MRTTPFAAVRSLFSITDEQAMWRVQNEDDETAFAQLVRRWEGPIRQLCGRMTGDAHRGEDLTQEAFARVFARRKEFRPDGRFSTWLWRIALNLCYDELRRRRRRPEMMTDDTIQDSAEAMDSLDSLAADDPPPDKTLMGQESGELVRQMLMRLPETYRTVLVMRHYENLKFREIAEVLDIPEGTVKSRMAEALSQIGLLLKPMIAEDNRNISKPTQKPHQSLVL